MTIKVRKVDLPDEITIETHGAKFIFDRPDNLDLFVIDFNSRRSQIEYVVSKLKRIDGVEFETGADQKKFKDLPGDVLVVLFVEYMKAFNQYHSGAEEKKVPEPTSSEGT